ncbi:MAG TPA: TolC family outer membrane protein [Geminicoccaceae bacterium]|nr:TolC family outer membrane protein [Geminicoccaceae bacterium]
MSRILFLAASALLCLGPASGLRAQTLEEALVAAYLTNPRLEAERANVRATDELVPQARAGFRPTLSLNSNAGITWQDTDFGTDTFTPFTNSLSLNQPLYRGGETTASVRRAEAVVRADRAALGAAEQQLLLDAAAAYTDVLAAQAVLDLANNNVQRLRRQLEATQDRFEVGEVTRTDVAQAEARVSQAISDQVQAAGALLATKATFRRVIGLEPQSLVRPTPLAGLPASEEEARRVAAEINPNIIAARFNATAARADVDVALSALRPRLSLNGELTNANEPTATIDNQTSASLGASLTVPLYQGGAESARVRQTKQILRQRLDQLDETGRAVFEEVTAAAQQLETATAQIRSITDQVRAAEIALEGARQEALVGARTTLDVLDLEQDLFQAQVSLVQAARDEIVASYRLKAAIGQLTVTELDLPVEPYEAEAHYRDVRGKWFGLGQPTRTIE